MARKIFNEPSRTLMEYRLLPGFTGADSTQDQIDLSTDLVCPTGQKGKPVRLKLPILAAAMQSVSGPQMGIAAARAGCLAFIFCSQSAESQSDMIKEIRDYDGNLTAAAAINTHDHVERVPALIKAGANVLLIDSSDGHSLFQGETIKWIRRRYPDIAVIGGNIITPEGFLFLAENGASAVKIGMGGGSICITQEQKGTGRGMATAIIKVSEARDEYLKKTGHYIPLIADGGIVDDKDIVIALALGANTVMMGRYFARMEESPTEKVIINNKVMKPYWGEGSVKARKWHRERYGQNKFVEGVEGFVECAGKLQDVIGETMAKIRASMSSCGCKNILELQKNAEVELISALSIREGKAHDIYMAENSFYASGEWGE